ncbi:fibroleukin-like [Saccostrea echinata]|uniref:fibroleukin-like n=1 Tax=Saccostrea echinata TaxID=191078 RepID=UPI002A82446E|nr:fibroleukin-like [Saccostrea echinata]
MDTMDGGWTAIQKRVDGSLSFDRTWTEYKNGFGDPEQNIWIGNDIIHQLTKGNNSSLYVSIMLVNGSRLYELYDQFSVSHEAEKYQLYLAGNAEGTLGDGMFNTGYYNINQLSGMYFSTLDRDNDRNTKINCAVKYKGGWWFNACYTAFLNGAWPPDYWTNPWYPTVKTGLSVKETKMMIRRQ